MKESIKNFTLLALTIIVCFIAIEIFYRTFDPFIFIAPWEVNEVEHGSFLQYDERLGWKGIPNKKGFFISKSNKVLIEHNKLGFRDLDHKIDEKSKEAIVFLGDSFTWGQEVHFKEAFVNILRPKLKQYELFNLAHRGYGTDQQLLTFKNWHYEGPLKLAILMFYENDFYDNNQTRRYLKAKPKYALKRDQLVLTNIPVPKDKKWVTKDYLKRKRPQKNSFKSLILRSHFIRDLMFRIKGVNKTWQKSAINYCQQGEAQSRNVDVLTTRIINELQNEITAKGGRLMVVAIPGKRQFMCKSDPSLFQQEIKNICSLLNIDFLDLGPSLSKTPFRKYYRYGIHWNRHAHKTAAKTIYQYLKQNQHIN